MTLLVLPFQQDVVTLLGVSQNRSTPQWVGVPFGFPLTSPRKVRLHAGLKTDTRMLKADPLGIRNTGGSTIVAVGSNQGPKLRYKKENSVAKWAQRGGSQKLERSQLCTEKRRHVGIPKAGPTKCLPSLGLPSKPAQTRHLKERHNQIARAWSKILLRGHGSLRILIMVVEHSRQPQAKTLFSPWHKRVSVKIGGSPKKCSLRFPTQAPHLPNAPVLQLPREIESLPEVAKCRNQADLC